MDALAVAAAEVDASAPTTTAPGGALHASDSEAGFAFPRFVGHRRRLPPDHELFEAGNIEREQLARQNAVEAARDERRQLSREAILAAEPLLGDHRFECHQCLASLPTARLLDIHVAEMHDSYFAAQAARRMPVYLCLVEGCSRKFCTVEERKQHLQDHHKFPRNFHFDRLHLRRKKAQIRPLPQLQKGHGRQAMASEGEAGEAAAASPAGASSAAAAGGLAGDAGDQQQQQPVPAAAAAAGAAVAAPPQADEVVAGLSRLSMAAEHSTVPSVIHFGRGRGRGLTGGGRGRGGQKGRGDGSTAPPPTAEGQ